MGDVRMSVGGTQRPEMRGSRRVVAPAPYRVAVCCLEQPVNSHRLGGLRR